MGQKEEELERTDAGVVVVKPKPTKGLASKAIDWLEWAFVKMMHDPKQPLHYLSGNFAPVDETPPLTDLPVKGHLPVSGLKMIHGMRIKDGKATYVSRFVKTSRIKQEEFHGGSKFMKIGDMKGMFGLIMVNMQLLRTKLKVLDVSYGYGTDAIKVLEDGDLQTIGMLDYDKRLGHSFTAHPKIDPVTGEMFTFGYSQKPPYITYRVISKEGVMEDPVPITVAEPIMMHDFAITENYAIFMDLPLYFRPKEMVKEKKFVFSFDSTKKARFGILPRYAKNELLISQLRPPPVDIFPDSGHLSRRVTVTRAGPIMYLNCLSANAWEEGDEVVLITCRLEKPDLDMVNGAVKEKLENFTNELKQRYVYGTILDQIAKVTGIVKFDLHGEPETGKGKLEVGGNVSGIFDLGPARFGSEAVFVPRQPGTTSEEDDGYLIFFVHDENTGYTAHLLRYLNS
ncbi:hypothetical protein DH2020_047009 [Rehmannia glutinosa]|uniref:carotenoid 9,10-dioxygenase n=1 Tax=Rehmannia glutinosa TaxID=99300 RepID=A0ABR0UB96_REHGL